MVQRASLDALRREARRRFGVTSFRPGQLELIKSVLAGKDAIGVLPTGAGKSLCFQLPALFLPKTTLVISPLIALMQDQQEKTAALNIASAKVDSTLSAPEEREVRDDVGEGRTELLYVTPERLESGEYLQVLKQAGVSLVVVDEAHCISQWGHDFRPAYLALRSAIASLGRPPVLALTATATAAIIEEIQQQLALRSPQLVNTGIDRDNLFLEVHRTPNEASKQERLLELVQSEPGAKIIYSATVRHTEEIYEFLRGHGLAVERYHGKLPVKQRQQAQRAFMTDDVELMVATNAFGLGVDKPNLRHVIHYEFPSSLETYYQEAGRAGRDGAPARASLLYRLEDKRVQSYFLGGKYPKASDSIAMLKALEALREARGAGPFSLEELTLASELPKTRAKVILAQLERVGILTRAAGGFRIQRELADQRELEQLLEEYGTRHDEDRERIESMMHYAQTTGCRWQVLQDYFGSEAQAECGHCDNCRDQPAKELARESNAAASLQSVAVQVPAVSPSESSSETRNDPAEPARQAPQAEPARNGSPRPGASVPLSSPSTITFQAGEQVWHRQFGRGRVVKQDATRVQVAFESGEAKWILTGFLKPSQAA